MITDARDKGLFDLSSIHSLSDSPELWILCYALLCSVSLQDFSLEADLILEEGWFDARWIPSVEVLLWRLSDSLTQMSLFAVLQHPAHCLWWEDKLKSLYGLYLSVVKRNWPQCHFTLILFLVRIRSLMKNTRKSKKKKRNNKQDLSHGWFLMTQVQQKSYLVEGGGIRWCWDLNHQKRSLKRRILWDYRNR